MGAILNLALGCLLILQEWDLSHGLARIAPWGQGLILALGPLFVWREARRETRRPGARHCAFQVLALLAVLLACLSLLHNAASKRFRRTWPVTSEFRLLESSQKIRRDFQAFLSELREPLLRWSADDCLRTREACFEKLDALARSRGSERSEEHTSELQSLRHLVCRLLLEKKKTSTLTHFKHRQINAHH